MSLRHHATEPASPSRLWLGLVNAVPNVFWSVLCLTPVFLYWYNHVLLSRIYLFLGASTLLCVTPRILLQRFELSANPAVYRRLHVHLVNRYSQGGIWTKRVIGRNFPHFNRPLVPAALDRTSLGRERFHLAGLCFFLCVTGHAIVSREFTWALALMVSNVVYNLYPVWFQQYLRIRLRRVSSRAR